METFSQKLRLMGSDFELVVVSESQSSADVYLNAAILEIQRIENILSEFKQNSETSLINDNAGIAPVYVSEEVFQIISRAISISGLTQGAFDVSMAPLKKIYQFKNRDFNLPSEKDLASHLALTGYKKIQLYPDNKVFLPHKGMAISFAAIGKGYAADQVKKLWRAMGLENGVISAAGDLCAMGRNANGQIWKIGVANPENTSENIAWMPVYNMAVATSGDYEQYFMFDNERYSHTINPVNGRPCKSLKSVTVISPSAELSDALATAVYVLGIEKGLFLVDQLPNTHSLIVDEFNKVHLSRNSIFEYET